MVSRVTSIISPEQALPGRAQAMQLVSTLHSVLNTVFVPPFPQHTQQAMFGMGCFWGVERLFWQQHGVYTTAVGYSAGFTPNPLYEEVCSGMTGHNEVVLVVFDPEIITYQQLLQLFWQSHNPTQGLRQGNDIGAQYRSGIYCFSAQQCNLAKNSLIHYQQKLYQSGFGEITTEILPASHFYYAEHYHQQYLAKNPLGYCGLRGLAVDF